MISTKLVSLFVKNRNFWDFLQWEDHPETTSHFRYEKKSPPPKAQEKKILILIDTYTIRENHNTQFLQWNNTRYLEQFWKKGNDADLRFIVTDIINQWYSHYYIWHFKAPCFLWLIYIFCLAIHIINLFKKLYHKCI